MKNQALVNDETQKKKKSIEHWKVIVFYLLIYDIVAVNASYFAELWLRFDLHFSHIPLEHLNVVANLLEKKKGKENKPSLSLIKSSDLGLLS